jgi:hypothetical protein
MNRNLHKRLFSVWGWWGGGAGSKRQPAPPLVVRKRRPCPYLEIIPAVARAGSVAGAGADVRVLARL